MSKTDSDQSGGSQTGSGHPKAAAQLKEYLEGTYGDDHEDILPESLTVDDPDILRLIRDAEAAGLTKKEIRENEVIQRALPASMDRTVYKATQQGDYGRMDAIKGEPSTVRDISGYHTIEQLEGMMSDAGVYQLYLYGDQGAGKTDFAELLGGEVSLRVWSDVTVASNITTDPHDDVETYEGVEDWLDELDGTDKTGIYILDEGSNELGFINQHRGQQLAALVKLFRKYGANIIIIGHTGRDIARDLRRLCTLAHKQGHKTVTFGEACDDRGRIEEADKMMTVAGVPQTNIRYDTEETSNFHVNFGDEEKDEDEQKLERLLWRMNKLQDMTQGEIAEEAGMSQPVVSRAVNAYEERLEEEHAQHDEDLAELTENLQHELALVEREATEAMQDADLDAIDEVAQLRDRRDELAARLDSIKV